MISVETNDVCCEEFIMKRITMFINISRARDEYHGKGLGSLLTSLNTEKLKQRNEGLIPDYVEGPIFSPD